MKKIIMVLCLFMSFLCISGCSNENKSSGQDKQKQSLEFDIDNFEWSFSSAIVDGKRMAAVNIKNNSDKPIVNIDLKFKFKDNVTEEQKEQYYKEIKEMLDASDEDITFIKRIPTIMWMDYDNFIKPESEAKNIPLYYCEGFQTVNDIKYCDLVDADYMTITYIYNDILYEMTYDFINETSSINDLEEKANQWNQTKLEKLLPTPKAEFIEENYDNESDCSYTVYGVNQTDFQTYCKACKEKGYTMNVVEDNTEYHAKNEENYDLSILYDHSYHTMLINLSTKE